MLPNLEQVCFVAQDLEDISALSELKNINKVRKHANHNQARQGSIRRW